MKWTDYESYLEIYPPDDFSFEECLIFLSRTDKEVLHKIESGSIYKLIKVKESLVLFKIEHSDNTIKVEFPISTPLIHLREKVAEYIWEWFDLERDLSGFYQMAGHDKVLKELVQSYNGLRIICMPDLFEALVWAVMGQQINLTFAYTLKKRFVEQYGESLSFEGETFWVFPSFEKIAFISSDDLRKHQFTSRKAEYIIGIAKTMLNGELTKEILLQKQDYEQVKKTLMLIKGVGAWTADYVMMKCLHFTSSLPIADVGLHNAIKNVLGLDMKPTIEEIKEYAATWEGWEAYATFYLWRSLYDKRI
jgi:DNA-3-methyladenine glycosylase II